MSGGAVLVLGHLVALAEALAEVAQSHSHCSSMAAVADGLALLLMLFSSPLFNRKSEQCLSNFLVFSCITLVIQILITFDLSCDLNGLFVSFLFSIVSVLHTNKWSSPNLFLIVSHA